MGTSRGNTIPWRRSGIARIMRIMSGPMIPQSHSALAVTSAAAASQNPPRLSIVSYKYRIPRPMSRVNSTLRLCARNRPYGTCETSANASNRPAYRLMFEV